MSGGHRGLFLDLDGTLADSLGALRGVYHAFLARHGAEGSEAEFQRLNGPPLSAIITDLALRHGLQAPHAALMELYAGMAREAMSRVAPAAGARNVLERAARLNWRVAVVTSAARAHTLAWLDRENLLDLIGTVVAGDDVVRGKPDPEPYLTALARLDCDPRRSLAVEDGVQGATAAMAAGLPTAVLMPLVPDALATHPKLRHRLDRFAEIDGLL